MGVTSGKQRPPQGTGRTTLMRVGVIGPGEREVVRLAADVEAVQRVLQHGLQALRLRLPQGQAAAQGPPSGGGGEDGRQAGKAPFRRCSPQEGGRGRRSKCQNHAAQPVFGFWRRRHRTAWARCALLATCPITLPRGGRIWGCPEGLPSRPPFWCCLKFQPVQPGGGRGCKSRSEGLPRVPRPFRGTTSHSVSSSVYTLHRVCE